MKINTTPYTHNNKMKDGQMMNKKLVWIMPLFSQRIKKKNKKVQDENVLDSLTSCSVRSEKGESRKKHLDSCSHHSDTTCATGNDEDFMMNTTTYDEYIQEEKNDYNIADLIFEYSNSSYNEEEQEERKDNATKCYMVSIPHHIKDGEPFFVKAGTTLLEMICPHYHDNWSRRENYNTLVFELVPCVCDLCCSCHNTLDDTVLGRRKRRHYPQLHHVRVVNYSDFIQFTRDIEAIIQKPISDCPSNLNQKTASLLRWVKGWNSFTNVHIEQLRLALMTTKTSNDTAVKRIIIVNAPTQCLEAILDVLVMSDNNHNFAKKFQCADEKRLKFQNRLEVQLDVTFSCVP